MASCKIRHSVAVLFVSLRGSIGKSGEARKEILGSKRQGRSRKEIHAGQRKEMAKNSSIPDPDQMKDAY